MATRAAKSTSKSKPKSNRGGSRAGAGRKPKAITEMREALIVPMLPVSPTDGSQIRTAADFALKLFEDTMRDEGKALDLRLDCAREVLNRTIGKPRVAEAPALDTELAEQVHIYMPDNGRESAAG